MQKQGPQKRKKDEIFKQKKHLGKGNFGCVDKCLSRLDGKTYAVKTIDINSNTMVQSIYQEAKAMKKARSDFTVQLLDHFEDQQLGAYILVMPYYRKGSLSCYMNDQWQKVDILCLLYQIDQAFLNFYKQNKQKYDHSGCWHLDLKPDNILVKSQGQYLIADFGCAKIVDNINNSRLLQISYGRGGGTTEYGAPQLILQFKGGKYSDMWSIGIIIYYILYKRNPVTDCGMKVSQFMQKFVKGLIKIQYPKKDGYEQIIQICKLMLQPQKRLQWQHLRQFIYQCLGLPLKIDIVVNIERFISYAQNVSRIVMGLVYYINKNQKNILQYGLKIDAQRIISSSKAYIALLYRQVQSTIQNVVYDKKNQPSLSSTFYIFPQIQRNYYIQQKSRLKHLRSVVEGYCHREYVQNLNVHFFNIKINFYSDVRDFYSVLKSRNIDYKLSHPFYQWEKVQSICAFILRKTDKNQGLQYSDRDTIYQFSHKILYQ